MAVIKKISELDAVVTLAEGDLVAGVDVSDTTEAGSGTTKKYTAKQILESAKDSAVTFTNKTISVDNNTVSGIAATSFVLSNSSGNIDGSVAQKDIPSGVVVGTTDTQTLTNKTLTSPAINTPTITTPTVRNWDGWQDANETWTYASASTFTVSGDQRSKYTVGTRLKFTQTTVKYAVVVSSSYSSPNTTVTIAVNTDYTIANATISANYYSYASNPVGYPGWFNFVPSISASTTSPTLGNATYQARFSLNGKTCTANIMIFFGSTTSFGSGDYYLNLPITPEGNGTNSYRQISGVLWGFIQGEGKIYSDTAFISGNATLKGMLAYKAGTAVAWAHNQPGTWASGDQFGGSAVYEID